MINRVHKIDDRVYIRNILISVADKKNLEEFVPRLIRIVPDVHLFSTGGTLQRISDMVGEKGQKHVTSVSDYTGQPEMQGGLVKTLDFRIYLGLLSEPGNSDHREDLRRTGAVQFDMVVVNLYPFGKKIREKDTTMEDARAFIDIGGPCMLRAAAKNYLRVAPICDPRDYDKICGEMEQNDGAVSAETRFTLARKAFAHTASYDREISGYMESRSLDDLNRDYSVISGNNL